LGDNQLKDVFVRFKALADRKKEVYDDDLIALMQDTASTGEDDHMQLRRLRVVCGTDGPQEAEMTLQIGETRKDHRRHRRRARGCDLQRDQDALSPRRETGTLPGPRGDRGDGCAGHRLGRLEQDGRVYTGQSSDTDTVVASAKAYVNALNKLYLHRNRADNSALMQSAS
jgi:2-isopropylmalate synthase